MKHCSTADRRFYCRMAGLGLFLLVGCAQSQPLTFLDDMTGPDAGTGSGGSDGTGGMPVDGSGGSGSGGTGTGGTIGSGGTGSGGTGTGGTGSGGTGTGGTTGSGGSGSGGSGTGGSGSGGMGTGGTTGSGGRGSGGSTGSGGSSVGTGGSGSGGNAGLGGTTGTGGTSGRGGSGGQSGNQGTGGAAGGPAATFTQVYTMILDAPSSSKSSCAGSGCHIPAPGAAGISFDTQAHAYQTLLSNAVSPGNTAKSVLYTNISSGAMPQGRTKLSATLIALVASWINAGALNN
jgi:hypothetical protein